MRKETDPDAGWVAALAGVEPATARRAVERAAAEERLFRHIVREHRAEGREGYVEIDAPWELFALARLLRPRHVVEVGVSSGVSSAYLLAALERNRRGTLHSVDRPSRPRSRGRSRNASWSLPPGRESGWAVPDDLRHRWDLRIGDKAEVVPLLADELPEVGLFVYDVPHDDDNSGLEFSAVDQRMPPGAVAVVDHGPGGGLCEALQRWATNRTAEPVHRTGLGLYGFRCGPRPAGPTGQRSTATAGRRKAK